jgi:preprotein translocase subunit YajC
VLISPAWAQGAGAPQGGGIENILLILGMFAVLYFLMIRPQMKRAKEHKTMVDGIQKGDEIVTVGGILARVGKVDEQYLTVIIASGVEVQMQRSAIQVVLPKGTIKTLQ